jgi:hypothetical protein
MREVSGLVTMPRALLLSKSVTDFDLVDLPWINIQMLSRIQLGSITKYAILGLSTNFAADGSWST